MIIALGRDGTVRQLDGVYKKFSKNLPHLPHLPRSKLSEKRPSFEVRGRFEN